MKALVYGAGKIARGFIGQLLAKSNYQIVFVDVDLELISLLNQEKSYIVHVLGDESLNTKVKNFKALHVNEIESIAIEMEDVSLVFTSVGGKNLFQIGIIIAEVWKKTLKHISPTNYITCENWKDAVVELRNGIFASLNQQEQESFLKTNGISEAVVMRISTEPAEENLKQEPLGQWVQNYWELPINSETFLGEAPKVEGITLKEKFQHFLEQKMYTNNTSNALIAYYGSLLGYRIVAEASNSPQVLPLLEQIYAEINETLIAEFGVSESEQISLAEMAKNKYMDWEIVDTVERHAKDPIRKLGPNDRLIAPARMALKHGVKVDAMIVAIVSAMYYRNENDEGSSTLFSMRKESGNESILKSICGLSSEEDLYSLVLNKIEEMRKAGVLHE